MGIKAGLAIGAGCLLTACAMEKRVAEDNLSYAPAPASTLVSSGAAHFKVAQVQAVDSRKTVLAHHSGGASPTPVASISTSDATVSVALLPSGMNAAALEQLYALALNQDPEAKFCLAVGTQECAVGEKAHSHGELLRELVRTRQGLVGQASVPWRVVSMASTPLHGDDEDEVAVRVSGDQGPLVGVTVFFNRAPHSSCHARTGADGVATCHLVDQHGDEDEHAGEEKTPVVVTFPGDVRKEGVFVPTTYVLQRVASK